MISFRRKVAELSDCSDKTSFLVFQEQHLVSILWSNEELFGLMRTEAFYSCSITQMSLRYFETIFIIEAKTLGQNLCTRCFFLAKHILCLPVCAVMRYPIWEPREFQYQIVSPQTACATSSRDKSSAVLCAYSFLGHGTTGDKIWGEEWGSLVVEDLT